jgi:hypothetical protein
MFVDTYHASSSEAVLAEDGTGLRSRHVSESHRVTTKSVTVCTPSTQHPTTIAAHRPLPVPVIHA